MKTHAFRFVLVLIFIMLAGCGEARTVEPTITSPPPAPPTNTVPPTDTATPTVDAAATHSAQQTTEAQATAEAEEALETQAALNKAATATELAAVKLTATAGVNATATAYATDFMDVIQRLQDDGVVATTEGDYVRLENFEGNEAQINQPFVYFLGIEAVDFAITADIEWESASMKANWPTSGCGFVYGFKDRYNADITFLGLDGYTHSLQYRQDRPVGLFAFKKWGDPERPKGSASVLLVVFDKRVWVYVNEALANEFYNSLYTGGQIGLNIFSGTNADFGTRCKMNNINLFIFR
jgi:hypothetical protein